MAKTGTNMILVVDDNEDVRRLVRKVLESSGYEVIEASSGEEALGMTEIIVPDLVLMDVRLSGNIDGLEATRRIKADPQLGKVPVIAMTASVLERDRSLALSAGCNGFIGKPIDITKLTSMIEKFITIRK